MNTTTQPQATPNGRDAKGQFTIGNGGGPGNPHARQVAELRKTLLQCVTPEVMQSLAAKLIELAQAGNLQAIKLLLSYTLGKPAAAVDPDRVDLDEWALLKATAGIAPEMPQVVHAPDASLPLTVARASQPAAAREMAQQLLGGIFAMDPACAARVRAASQATEQARSAEPPSANGSHGPSHPATPSGNGDNGLTKREAVAPNGSNGESSSPAPPANGKSGPTPPATVPVGAVESPPSARIEGEGEAEEEEAADDRDRDRLPELGGDLELFLRSPRDWLANLRQRRVQPADRKE